MKPVPKEWRGLHTLRYRDNPLEQRFATEWANLNKVDDPGRTTLAYMLCVGDQRHPLPPTDRERTVASTVVQWLGSPVGSRWVLGVLANDESFELGTTGERLERARQIVGPGPVFSAAEIEFMAEAEGMELDDKHRRMYRRILKKMKANG
jgi:hypothetical protein